MRPNNLFLSIPKVAALLGRGPASVRRAIQRGDLAAVKVPGCQPRVPAAVVASILEAAPSARDLARAKEFRHDSETAERAGRVRLKKNLS